MTTEPRICIVGAGALSSRRIYPYIATAGARLVGVCDLDQGKAERNARLYGGQVFNDMEKMLTELKPDGVIICIGPEHHAPMAIKALRLGFPVYTEKPPAASAAEAFGVVQVARETGLLCVTAFKKRYTEAANRAKKWLEQFPEEDRYSISVDYCSLQYANDSPKRSFLLDFTVHILDLTQYLWGDVAEVFAFSKGPDAYAVSLKFTNGSVGSLNLNDGRSFTIPTEELELTVKGGNYMTIHNSSVWKITEGNKPCEWREPPTFTSSGDSGRETGHLSELEDFIKAVAEGRRASRSDIYEGYKTMALYEAIRDSAATGAPIRLTDERLAPDPAANPL
jgi:predicted dehydrogenase